MDDITKTIQDGYAQTNDILGKIKVYVGVYGRKVSGFFSDIQKSNSKAEYDRKFAEYAEPMIRQREVEKECEIPNEKYNFLRAEPCLAGGFAFPEMQDEQSLVGKLDYEPAVGGV